MSVLLFIKLYQYYLCNYCDLTKTLISIFSEKNLVKDSSTEMRQKALELLNNATETELRLVKGITTKKFEVIVGLRPFSTWYDAVSKCNKMKRY